MIILMLMTLGVYGVIEGIWGTKHGGQGNTQPLAGFQGHSPQRGEARRDPKTNTQGATMSDTTPVADEVTTKLSELGVDAEFITKIKEDLGVTTTARLPLLTESDLVGAGMKAIPARELVKALAPAAPTVDTPTVGVASFDVLPSVPDDASWLTALQAGGVLKVDQSSVISAIRAALASRVGLYDIPKKLVALMESFADTSEEQVDAEFFKLSKQLTRRSYGDIFAAIDGLDGNYVTEQRKKELFRRIDTHLWPAIASFNSQLKAWQEAWMQGAANPAMLMATIMSAGNSGIGMPPGMMQPPDTGILRDNALAVNDAINRVFAGTGVPIATALAYEASEIKKSLENPRLPALIGVANREQMLKELQAAVSPTYPRMEANLTRFVLGIMQASDQPAGNEELQYFGALYMLGSQIPWDQLGISGRSITGIAGNRL
jgi:hypothetical protein